MTIDRSDLSGGREILSDKVGILHRLAMLAPQRFAQGKQDDYPYRIPALEEYTENGRRMTRNRNVDEAD